LIRCRKDNSQGTELFEVSKSPKWRKAQSSFLHWTKNKNIFTEKYIGDGKTTFDALFKALGPLRGSILDIGGGWGLFRQWWEPTGSDIFIVHDPGVERFLQGPHELHRNYYERAFGLPMSFVEGFGEELPYEDEIFDTSIIAATLDHCLDPKKVISEAHRCLKPGGTLIVIQSCVSSQPLSNSLNIAKRLLKHLHNPVRFATVMADRLFQPDHHLHRFTSNDVALLLEHTGFSEVHINIVPTTQDITTHNVYAFETEKSTGIQRVPRSPATWKIDSVASTSLPIGEPMK
jgi:SAM-dependent methyltransferase